LSREGNGDRGKHSLKGVQSSAGVSPALEMVRPGPRWAARSRKLGGRGGRLQGVEGKGKGGASPTALGRQRKRGKKKDRDQGVKGVGGADDVLKSLGPSQWKKKTKGGDRSLHAGRRVRGGRTV